MNLLGNEIPPEQAQELIDVMEAKENLVTLCGLKGTETELDLSGKGLRAGCAVLLAHEMKDMGALASLNISGNRIDSAQQATIKQICADKSIQCTL